MRELTTFEIKEISGGIVWVIVCGAALGIAAGAAYISGYHNGSNGSSSTSINVGVGGYGAGGTVTMCTSSSHP